MSTIPKAGYERGDEICHHEIDLDVQTLNGNLPFRYTPGSTNIAGWRMHPEDVFAVENGIFQPAMLVYQRVFVCCFFLRFFGMT